MRNKKMFSFDEEKDAEKIIVEGFKDGNIDYSEMYLVAKYFRDKLGYGEIRLERELIKFCKAQNKNFNPITEADAIQKWIKGAMSYGLKKVDKIFVSRKEIEFLNSIENQKERKLLFSTLVIAKAIKNKYSSSKNDLYYIHYNNFQDIIRLSEVVGISETKFADILFKYKDVITLYNPQKELVRIDFASPPSQKNDDFVIMGSDNIMDFYNKHIIKNKGVCSICGKEIIKKSNRQKTCEECSKILAQKRTEKWRNKTL